MGADTTIEYRPVLNGYSTKKKKKNVNTKFSEMAESRTFGYNPPPDSSERTRLLRLKVIAGHNLAKKDIFGASDPYTKIDLVTGDNGDSVDTVLTKTKKRTLNPKMG